MKFSFQFCTWKRHKIFNFILISRNRPCTILFAYFIFACTTKNRLTWSFEIKAEKLFQQLHQVCDAFSLPAWKSVEWKLPLQMKIKYPFEVVEGGIPLRFTLHMRDIQLIPCVSPISKAAGSIKLISSCAVVLIDKRLATIHIKTSRITDCDHREVSCEIRLKNFVQTKGREQKNPRKTKAWTLNRETRVQGSFHLSSHHLLTQNLCLEQPEWKSC